MALYKNPAQGIIGLYQDNQGNVFTKREIVKKEKHKNGELNKNKFFKLLMI